MMRDERHFRLALWVAIIAVAVGISAYAVVSNLPGVRDVELSPADGDEDVPITAPLRLAFSRAMDPASVESAFGIEPEITGRWVWDGKEAVFQPHGGLSPGTHYTVTLGTEAASENGHALRETHIWRFRTRTPQLLFLGRPTPEADLRQLFVHIPDTAESRQLTDHAQGVWDYAVHPQGEGIVYSVLRADGGADLWHMERDGRERRVLQACPETACLNPAWSPDGRLLAYEQRDIWADAPNLDPKAGRIWLLDLEEGKDRPLFAYEVPLHSPVWSPVGRRLAYVSPTLPGVEAYTLDTEELRQFGNQWGTAPVWSPGGDQLVVPELLLAGEELVVRLVRLDLETEEVVDISGSEDDAPTLVKDVSPAWSPGGGWIAFGRQFLDSERWTPGRQIWLTRPDASEAYDLLTEPMADHFAFAWRPDGAVLAFARSDLSEGPQPVPEVSVWLFDFSEGKPFFVADDGVLPKWLP
jgi:Tol biopolymer transport system component